MSGETPWWDAPENAAHDAVLRYVWDIDRRQSAMFERFVRLEALYDPNGAGSLSSSSWNDQSQIVDNLIAGTVDTVTAVVAASEIRPRFMTDDGDWSTQQRARALGWYIEALIKKLRLAPKAVAAFKEAAKKGTGILKVYADAFGNPTIDHVLVEDIVVDEAELRSGGEPRQMHQRRCNVDRAALKAQFPQYAKQIDAAQTGQTGRQFRSWAGRAIARYEIVVVESWRLPIGGEDDPGHVPGRHTIVIDGCTLLDEPWNKPRFPFAVMRWSTRAGGWYGIGLAERIAGHQRASNKRNWQIDRQLDQHAVPTTYVRPADANLAVRTTSRLGTIAVVKAELPQTVIPQAVSAETYNHLDRLNAGAYENSGVSRMAAQSHKPAGLDSGVALREYRDQTTQRFATQEKEFERDLWLDACLLLVDVCKDLGSDAPDLWRQGKYGQRLRWNKVDVGEAAIQIAAASTLSRTPAGRIQSVLEWAQAGLISQDETRRLLNHPDIDRSVSLMTAAIEDVESTIEAIEDGELVVPEPYQHLEMLVKRLTMAYLRDKRYGAPETVLEGFRSVIVQAQYLLNSAAAPMAPQPGMPAEAPPQAALSAQAMNLMAG